MMATINNIADMNAPAPPLIQGDHDIPFCNRENRLDSCTESITCHCVHLIELDLCDVYELLLFDANGKFAARACSRPDGPSKNGRPSVRPS